MNVQFWAMAAIDLRLFVNVKVSQGFRRKEYLAARFVWVVVQCAHIPLNPPLDWVNVRCRHNFEALV